MCALRAKELSDVLSKSSKKTATTGSEPVAGISADSSEKWRQRDAHAMYIITSAMDFGQVALIEGCESTQQIIDKLDSSYDKKSEMTKMMLHEQFASQKMETSDSMSMHIAKVENIARQLRDSGENISEIAVITKIIGSLPDKYRSFRQAWLSVDESRQTITNLTARLLDEEASMTAINEEGKALVTTKENPVKKKKML